jgi:hypothetical protein
MRSPRLSASSIGATGQSRAICPGSGGLGHMWGNRTPRGGSERLGAVPQPSCRRRYDLVGDAASGFQCSLVRFLPCAHVLTSKIIDLDAAVQACKPRRLPVRLTSKEGLCILDHCPSSQCHPNCFYHVMNSKKEKAPYYRGLTV